MNLKQGRLLQGLRSLAQHCPEYQYSHSPTHVYTCCISELLQHQLAALHPEITPELLLHQFQEYLALPKELLGKRSSEIMVSQSRGLCLKLMDEVSLAKMEQVAPELWHHRQQHPSTCLVDVLRVYRVGSRKDGFRQCDVFLLMPGLMPRDQQSIAVYDLKGYTEGREIGESEYGIFKFGKDDNFVHSKEMYLLEKLSKQERTKLVADIVVDIQFLEARGIIDYSLLLAFQHSSGQPGTLQGKEKEQKYRHIKCVELSEGVWMRWGIIDYFQEYNNKKKAQNKFKTLFFKEVSSVQPSVYAQRLIKFLIKTFHIAE